MAELGAGLVLVDRPEIDLHTPAQQVQNQWSVRTWCIPCDLENENERNQLIPPIKNDGQGLNVLISNAAFGGSPIQKGWFDIFEQQTLSTWRRAFELNLTAAFYLCQAFSQHLRQAKGGNIINIESIYGKLGPVWRLYEGTGMGIPTAYAATKGGRLNSQGG